MNLSGNNIDFLAAFLGGVTLSFSPCVYPLIPVSLGFIGARTNGSKLKGLNLSLIYVTGVAFTYSILGMVASLSGKLFGAVSSHPLTYIFVGLVIVGFGLSMLEVFMIPLPHLIKLPLPKKQDYLSAFLLGLSSGLIVSPCLTPVLGGILAYLITKKNILYAATLLFSFAYGMGLVLILAGTFSNILTKLPKSGRWMVYIKKLWATVLFGMGTYFVFTGIRRL